MLPIVIEMGLPDWTESLMEFTRRLKRIFGSRLVRVVALPSPDLSVYDSNVLVVLDSFDREDVRKVVRLALEVDERINPLVAGKWEMDAVEAFTAPLAISKWRTESLMEFTRRLKRIFGSRLVRVVALPSPDLSVYDSNVLVVLDSFDREDVRKVVRLALEVDERINPLVAGKWEMDAVEAFTSEGGADIEVREG